MRKGRYNAAKNLAGPCGESKSPQGDGGEFQRRWKRRAPSGRAGAEAGKADERPGEGEMEMDKRKKRRPRGKIGTLNDEMCNRRNLREVGLLYVMRGCKVHLAKDQ